MLCTYIAFQNRRSRGWVTPTPPTAADCTILEQQDPSRLASPTASGCCLSFVNENTAAHGMFLVLSTIRSAFQIFTATTNSLFPRPTNNENKKTSTRDRLRPNKQITKFLNEFEVSVRYKLSTLAERVGSLERHLEYCETVVKDKERLQRFNSMSESTRKEGR